MNKSVLSLAICGALTTIGCATTSPITNQLESSKNHSIAFLPDIHLHDIYAKLDTEQFKGLTTSTANGKKQAFIRSMKAQLNSTRLFNENYFALLATLDDIVSRGIKYVAMPGDFSDDGQTAHVKGLVNILDHYSEQHGLVFFAAPGNHDPTRPFTHPSGKWDYLGSQGKEQPIFSPQHPLCNGSKSDTTKTQGRQPLLCVNGVEDMGYQDLMQHMAGHGFFPQVSHLFFATPFYFPDPEEYQFDKAEQASHFNQRQFSICHQGSTLHSPPEGYTGCSQIFDASYLVEPFPGVWLLSIDANVYLPRSDSTGGSHTAKDFYGSGSAGYNKVASHKSHLIDWIKDVVVQAKLHNKRLVAFSHFPMTEFYDNASSDIANFTDKTFKLERKPLTKTSDIIADTGLSLHIAGHMHYNDTGYYQSANGNHLFNIQAPSLAGYVPAYKVVSFDAQQASVFHVETHVVEQVPNFKTLFTHYHQEWEQLNQQGDQSIWDKAILEVENYRDFTRWHLTELSRLNFFSHWPQQLKHQLNALTGLDIAMIALLDSTVTTEQFERLLFGKQLMTAADKSLEQKLLEQLQSQKLNPESLKQWTAIELGMDFYRFRNADSLAMADVPPWRLQHYQQLFKLFNKRHLTAASNPHPLQQQLAQVLVIFEKLTRGLPSENFTVNVTTGEITPNK